MTALYPDIAPYSHGLLDVGHDDRIYWETCGNPDGKPALVLHGGPGSGCTPWHRRLFDPASYRIVLFDQRGCGRSTPHASAPQIDLATNNTQNLIADLEALRTHLKIDRWLLLGGSWGCALAIAYAEQFPDRVTQMVLWGANTARRQEFDWLFRGGVAVLFPEQWERLRSALPPSLRDGDVVEGYARLLHDADPAIRAQAALDWCTWESVTPAWPPARDALSPRFRDPDFALAFARLVTHYVRHDGFVEDGGLLHEAGLLAHIPAVIVSGRYDFQAPLGWAWELARAWPGVEHVIVDDAGHDASNESIARELVRATDKFAAL